MNIDIMSCIWSSIISKLSGDRSQHLLTEREFTIKQSAAPWTFDDPFNFYPIPFKQPNKSSQHSRRGATQQRRERYFETICAFWGFLKRVKIPVSLLKTNLTKLASTKCSLNTHKEFNESFSKRKNRWQKWKRKTRHFFLQILLILIIFTHQSNMKIIM